MANQIGVQAMSMQWLDFSRIARYTEIPNDEVAKSDLSVLIAKVISTYNREKERFKKIRFKGDFEHQYVPQFYKNVEKTTTSLTTTLKKGGADDLPTRVSAEFILFFYRQKPVREIAALTTGQAWKAVRECVMYEFPVRVAKRVLNPNAITKISRRCLVGSDVQETLVNPSGREIYKASNLYYMFESFTCVVKKNSSLMQLSLFEEIPSINISTGLVRIMKKIPLEEYPVLLNLFSRYAYKQKSYTTDGVEEKADAQFEFLDFLRPAYIMSSILNKSLVSKVFKDWEDENCQRSFLRHKHLQDYLTADSYEIQLREGARYKELPHHPPTLDEIIALFIAEDDKKDFTEESFRQLFENAKIRWAKGGSESVAPLIEYLEGEVRGSDGVNYFKIRNMWYKLTLDYTALLHEDFKKLLKKTLLKSGDTGYLPHSWFGNKRGGRFTEATLKNEMKISKDIRKLMTKLKTASLHFVSKDGTVNQTKLVGEILKIKVISSNQDAIEEHILSKNIIPLKKDLAEFFDKEDLEKILLELKKERSLLQDKDHPFVVNPFMYPLKKDPLVEDNFDQLTTFLENLCKESSLAEDEETYNRSYLYDKKPYGASSGFLVFDQICPDNIEPCDVLQYTQDSVYLYHVKEEFGQHTRDACSQILNAAKEFRSALSADQPECYIEKLWRKSVEGEQKDQKEWRKKVKKQSESLGKEAFLNIFYERKITFVYAFLQTLDLQKEASTPSCLSPASLSFKDPKQSEEIFKALKNGEFLDSRGRLTGKFLGSNKEKFKLNDFEKESPKVYDQLSKYKSQSQSTLAKLELLHLAKELDALGFDFKICPIQRKGVLEKKDQSKEEEIDFEEDKGDDLFVPKVISKIENGPIGLENIGNSCYMNATLQLLFNIPEIREEIEEKKDETSLLKKLHTVLNCLNVAELKKHLSELRSEIFTQRGGYFEGVGDSDDYINQQHDASEFLTFVLDKLDWKSFETSTYIEIRHGIQEKNPEQCSYLTIALVGSLKKSIKEHFAEEAINDKNNPFKYKFQGRNCTASKWTQSIKIKGALPKHLIVHLKRFDKDDNKITRSMDLPEDGEISLSSTEYKAKYEICGYLNHLGPLSRSGHYTTDVKNFRDVSGKERWIHCNDEELREEKPENPEKDAYIVVLKKISQSPISSDSDSSESSSDSSSSNSSDE